MVKLNKCPFCGHEAISISVYDVDEKWKGSLGCDFEKDPNYGMSLYALHHEEWMSCILRCDDQEEALGGLFSILLKRLKSIGMKRLQCLIKAEI